MAREETRKFRVECDDGSTFASKHGSRGALSLPPGLSMWKPKKSGTHVIDVIPFVTTDARERYIDKMQFSRKVGVYFPHRIYRVHYGVGVNNDAVACLSRNFGKPCPICQAAGKLRESPSAENEQKANDLNPKERSLFLVYDRDETEKGVQLWEVAWYNFGRHVADYIDGAPKAEQPALKVYYHPTDGFTVRINCKETPAGKGKPYTDYLVHSMSPRTSPVPPELFDHGYDLDALVQELDYARVKALYTGEADADDDAPGDDSDGGRDDGARTTNSRNGDDDGHTDVPPPRGVINRAGAVKPEPPPAAKWIPAPDDVVTFEFKGEQTEGTVKKVDVDGKLASVKIDGRESLLKMDFSDLTLAESWADKKPTAVPMTPPTGDKPGWAADDDGRSFQRGKNKPAAAPPANDDPGDDPTPPKKRK